MAFAQRGAFLVGELQFPPSRGADPNVRGIGPCQGFEIGGRVEYPLSGGRVSWTATRDIEDITLSYSTSENPTSQDDFTAVEADFGRGYVGSRCVEGPDFESLGLSTGDQITLQWSFKAGPQKSQSFECADLTLVSPSDFAALNYSMSCENKIETTQMRSNANPTLTQMRENGEIADDSASSSSSTEGSGSGSGLSSAQSGAIGAMVSLVVVFVLLFVFQLFGFLTVGKKQIAARRSAATEENQNQLRAEKTVDSI